MCCACGGGAVPDEADGDEGDDEPDLEDIQIDADQLEEYELYIKVGLDHVTGDALSIHQWVSLEELREAVEGSEGESDEEEEEEEEEEGCAHVGYEDSGYGRREWCETGCMLAGGIWKGPFVDTMYGTTKEICSVYSGGALEHCDYIVGDHWGDTCDTSC